MLLILRFVFIALGLTLSIVFIVALVSLIQDIIFYVKEDKKLEKKDEK